MSEQTILPLSVPGWFLDQAQAIGVGFEPGEVERLGLFLAWMLETNKTHNLTAITDPEEAWRKHILDALTLLGPLSELPEGAKVLDVGSGGGVPGVPLAVCMPKLRFTLMDATGKKVDFLRRVSAALGLRNVQVVQDRAERLGLERTHREQFDAVIARAVGPMATLAELTLPFARVGGLMLAIKGAKAGEEVEAGRKAIGILGGQVDQILESPTGRIVVVQKRSATPRLYPRGDGLPKSKPLGMG